MPPTTKDYEPIELRVRVPASTSNLGPGFDQLGLALELYLDVQMTRPVGAKKHQFGSLGGTAKAWTLEKNLLPEAFDACLKRAGATPQYFEFCAHSEIPTCGGLGSSGAAVVAGLLLANLWLGPKALSPTELAELGCELEGHPDNSTASLFGGCTLGVPTDAEGLQVIQHPLHADFFFAVVWSSFQLETKAAREALPQTLPIHDVVRNLRSLSLLLTGLSNGDPVALRLGCRDNLHTPFRLPLIPGASRALSTANSLGAWLSAISGSGASLIAIHNNHETATTIAKAMASELREAHGDAEFRVLRASNKGAEQLI
ncbi:MAG: homoserine kinase [Planctomycetota bacterium]|jgi:homoserine kinase